MRVQSRQGCVMGAAAWVHKQIMHDRNEGVHVIDAVKKHMTIKFKDEARAESSFVQFH